VRRTEARRHRINDELNRIHVESPFLPCGRVAGWPVLDSFSNSREPETISGDP
jgi:hypothetical protein